jgi:hypoxanthine phosphoribosyltransferase
MDDPTPDVPRETLDWATYGVAVRELATTIAESGFRPELILGIARGGLFVAGSLGYALGVKNTFLINVEYYTGVNERLDVPVVLPPYLDPADLQDLRVLIADDVADTGHTLELVKEFCTERVAEVRVAVLYQKPHSVVDAEYVWTFTDRWINFPWSTEPPVVDPEGRVLVRDA